MTEEAERWAPLETGGVLMGAADTDTVWIEEMIGPGPNAVHRHAAFAPDAAFQQSRIAAVYQAAERRIAYLGDWHTHPGQPTILSWRDARTLGKIARSTSARQPFPIMAVLGGTTPWNLSVYRLARAAPIYWPYVTASMRLVVDDGD